MISFDLGGSINSFAKWICGAPIIHTVINNSFYTSLLITCIVAIVIMSNYHYRIKKNKRAVKTIIYIFLLVTAVMFVHHYAVTHEFSSSSARQGVRDVFESIQESRNNKLVDIVPVIPATYGGGQYEPFSARADNLEIQSVQLPFTYH
jgi:Mn2+/Fe2+ NRAMP family transporter